MKHELFFLLIICSLIFSCTSVKLNKTLSDRSASSNYLPISPSPVIQLPGYNCTDSNKNNYLDLLSSLPHQQSRLAVGEVSASGSISYGQSTIGVHGKSYEVILDYINVDIAYLPVYVQALIIDNHSIDSIPYSKFRKTNNKEAKISVTYNITPASKNLADHLGNNNQINTDTTDLVNIPVYIGVGLRLTAKVTVQKGKVNLFSLSSLSAGAETGKLIGNLEIETLGITGNSVTKILPLNSEINGTTIQNAILALGSIKAILYDNTTILTPTVVGIKNPIDGGPEVMNSLTSLLVGWPVKWYRPCK